MRISFVIINLLLISGTVNCKQSEIYNPTKFYWTTAESDNRLRSSTSIFATTITLIPANQRVASVSNLSIGTGDESNVWVNVSWFLPKPGGGQTLTGWVKSGRMVSHDAMKQKFRDFKNVIEPLGYEFISSKVFTEGDDRCVWDMHRSIRFDWDKYLVDVSHGYQSDNFSFAILRIVDNHQFELTGALEYNLEPFKLTLAVDSKNKSILVDSVPTGQIQGLPDKFTSGKVTGEIKPKCANSP